MLDKSDVTIWNIEKFIAATEFAELTRPIVIIFEDSEAFNPLVFSQFGIFIFKIVEYHHFMSSFSNIVLYSLKISEVVNNPYS